MPKLSRMKKKKVDQGRQLNARKVGRERIMYTDKDKKNIFENDLDEIDLRKIKNQSKPRPKLLLRRSRTTISQRTIPRAVKTLCELKKTQRSRVLASTEDDLLKEIMELSKRWNERMGKRCIEIPTLEIICNMTIPLQEHKLYKRIRVLSDCGVIDVSSSCWRKEKPADDAESDINTAHSILYTYCHRGIATRTLQDVLSACGSKVKAHTVWNLKKQLNFELDQRVPIQQLKPGSDAFYIDPEKLLKYILPGLVERGEIRGSQITICISGDGRNMNILREKASIIISLKIALGDSHSTKYLLPIALARGKECRENIALIMSALKESLQRVKRSGVAVFQRRIVAVRWTFCSDGKFLLMALGIHAANGKFSCPYCVLKKDFWIKSLEYSTMTLAENLRSPHDLSKRRGQDCCPAHPTIQACRASTHGADKSNLLEGIVDMNNVFIDELHLFLRLWDAALDYILAYCEHYSIERELTRIAKTQGISFFPIAGQLDKKHHQQWSHLDGKQSRKLLEVLCVPATLQKLVMERSDSSVEMPTVEREHRARFFTKFLSILTRLQYVQRFLASANRNSEDDISCFEAHARELGNQFIDFDKKNSTKWYLHMLVTHVGGQLRQEKSIAPFSCSAQERVNSQHYRMLQTCVQFHASSKQLLSMKRLQVMYEYVQTQFKKDETHYPKDRKSSLSSCVKEKSVPLGEEREEKAKRKKRTLPQV